MWSGWCLPLFHLCFHFVNSTGNRRMPCHGGGADEGCGCDVASPVGAVVAVLICFIFASSSFIFLDISASINLCFSCIFVSMAASINLCFSSIFVAISTSVFLCCFSIFLSAAASVCLLNSSFSSSNFLFCFSISACWAGVNFFWKQNHF